MKRSFTNLAILSLTTVCLISSSCSKKEPEPEKLVTPEQEKTLNEMGDSYEK